MKEYKNSNLKERALKDIETKLGARHQLPSRLNESVASACVALSQCKRSQLKNGGHLPFTLECHRQKVCQCERSIRPLVHALSSSACENR